MKMFALLKTAAGITACFFIYVAGNAQTKELPYHSLVKFNVASAADIIAFPTMAFSYERRIGKRISITGEFGYQFYQFPKDAVDTSKDTFAGQLTYNSDTSFVKPRGFKSSLEVRYYWLRLEKRLVKLSCYSAVNFFYRRQKTDVAMLYLKDSLIKTMDCYWMKRTNWGVMPVIGMQARYKKFIFEVAAGAGLSNRKVEDHNREYNNDKDYFQRNIHYDASRSYLSDYNEATVGFSLAVRLGMLIN